MVEAALPDGRWPLATVRGVCRQRIQEVAAEVGAPHGGQCGKGVNVLVTVTTTPDELMQDVRANHEELLGFHGTHETRDLAAFEPPMKSWYVTFISAPGYWAMESPYAPELPWSGHGMAPFQSHIVFTLVVIDARAIAGQAIGPVADKIAMLALSRPALHDGCSPLPSVLEVLDPKCPPGAAPEALTSYDLDYLKTLYAYRGDEGRYFVRRAIAKNIEKHIDEPPTKASASQPPKQPSPGSPP